MSPRSAQQHIYHLFHIHTPSFHWAYKILLLDSEQQPPADHTAPFTHQHPKVQVWPPAGMQPRSICVQVMLMAGLQVLLDQLCWGKVKSPHVTTYRLRIQTAEELHRSMFALQISLVKRHLWWKGHTSLLSGLQYETEEKEALGRNKISIQIKSILPDTVNSFDTNCFVMDEM